MQFADYNFYDTADPDEDDAYNGFFSFASANYVHAIFQSPRKLYQRGKTLAKSLRNVFTSLFPVDDYEDPYEAEMQRNRPQVMPAFSPYGSQLTGISEEGGDLY